MSTSDRTPLPFRFEPPRSPAWTLVRPRLVTTLAERFEARVVTVTGGGGYGKSTLLAHAIAENVLSPSGRDAWLRVIEHDHDPDHLLSGVFRALTDPSAEPPSAVTIDDVLDAAWALAPERVAILLDDVHRIGPDAPSWPTIELLIERLPTNASLVLAGRTRPPIPLTHLKGSDQLVTIDESDLAYTNGEAQEIAERLGARPSERVASWPALVTLQCREGARAGIEYLWEQVIESLPDDRRALLAIAAQFSSINDKLLAAIAPSSGTTAAELVAGLPLVEPVDESTFRLHDLWAEALDDAVDDDRRRDAARRAGEHLLEGGDLVGAAESFALAGDSARLAEVVRRASIRPLGSALDTAEIMALLDLLPDDLARGASGELLRAARLFATQPELCIDAYRRALALAERAGDDEDAVVAHWRITQLSPAEDPHSLTIPPGLQRLADDGHRMAKSACAMLRSNAAAVRGDVTTALAEIESYEIVDPDAARGSVSSRLLSLGRPELVDAHLDQVLADGVSDPFAGQAVWWRGEISPDLAWPIARELPQRYARRNMRVVQLALCSIVAQIGISAGDLAGARALIDQALDLGATAQPGDRLFAEAADVMYLAAAGDHAAAAEAIDRMESAIPVLPFPAWPYMTILAPIRALCDHLDALDHIELGPSMRQAVAAGAAWRAAMDGGDTGPARSLSWSQLDLLRVHVPPNMLVDLAVAASDPANAHPALAALPAAAAQVQHLASAAAEPVRSIAVALGDAYRPRPSQPLSVTTFGRFTVSTRNGVVLIGDRSRGKVRELASLLVLEGTVDRMRLAEQMWPDLEPARARENLRANLSHLQKTLSVPGEPSYLDVTDQTLGIDPSLLDVDRDRFEAEYSAATLADRQSNPSAALASYERAVGIVQGEYLPHLDVDEVRFHRIRLQSLELSAACRAAELLLAKGEPERSLELATFVLARESISERAARTAIGAYRAIGSAAAAREVAEQLLAELGRAGIRPEPETMVVAARLGVAG